MFLTMVLCHPPNLVKLLSTGHEYIKGRNEKPSNHPRRQAVEQIHNWGSGRKKNLVANFKAKTILQEEW